MRQNKHPSTLLFPFREASRGACQARACLEEASVATLSFTVYMTNKQKALTLTSNDCRTSKSLQGQKLTDTARGVTQEMKVT